MASVSSGEEGSASQSSDSPPDISITDAQARLQEVGLTDDQETTPAGDGVQNGAPIVPEGSAGGLGGAVGPIVPEVSVGELGGTGPVWFRLTGTSVLCLTRGDLTKWAVDSRTDAIVNAANQRMLGGGGVDGAIHRAAGPDLMKACRKVPESSGGVRCPTGEAVLTPGFRLRASHVIHTVGPVYRSPEVSAPLLASAYRNSLLTAENANLQYVAFPAISCGVYGYPYDEAADVAVTTIRDTLQRGGQTIKQVDFVLFERSAWEAWLRASARLLPRDPRP